MFEKGWMNKFQLFGDAVLLLLYVNFLWVCFTIAGLILFGIGPSTVAMFKIFREYWADENSDTPVFKTFLETFRHEFFRTNGLGLLLIVIPYMLYVNLNFLELGNERLAVIIHYAVLVAAIIYGIMLIYIFPMYVHYDNKLFNYFKNAILIAIYQPLRTIYAIAACLTLYYLFFVLPVFLFFFGASLTSFVLMWITYRTFLRIEYTQEKLQERAIAKGENTV